MCGIVASIIRCFSGTGNAGFTTLYGKSWVTRYHDIFSTDNVSQYRDYINQNVLKSSYPVKLDDRDQRYAISDRA